MKGSSFTKNLHNWFLKTPRVMPWNDIKDPYLIWLSEIILQQTRVQQGIPFYEKFSSSFPNVQTMANASEEDILSLWKGLGYYSRARNMHLTAKKICKKYDGHFPEEYDELLKLKGIGPYTAAAIVSFACGKKRAVVDGNVKRVLARHFLIDDFPGKAKTLKYFTDLANSLIDNGDPATFNRAMMNLGALVCTPRNPNCANCPLVRTCLAHEYSWQHELPTKAAKKKRRKRYFHFFILKNKKGYLVQKRTAGDIWKHLYQFPLIENEVDDDMAISEFLQFNESKTNYIQFTVISRSLQHLTHQIIKGRFYKMDIRNIPEEFLKNGIFADRQMLGKLPFPKIIDTFIKENIDNSLYE